ncbi:MAG TPA: ATP-binding protein, partial [Kofleriaceae bacterium]|nr:ATP-binding protein [Kofleriaceae bacterium]
MQLVGRRSERGLLLEALQSPEAELVAVFGRRRVGKTFLIREVYGDAICFELVGMHDADVSRQLRVFAGVLGLSSPPADWQSAFDQLRAFLTVRIARRRSKQVVFFDEVPWLASRRSGFLAAFEQFWNGWAVKQRKLVVVICGSAASWMLQKIVRQRGGLHNRVTRRIRLEPFSLVEIEEFLRSRHVAIGRYQMIELYMALGGIPHYLAQVRPGESAAEAIDRLCFARDGLLRTEFTDLYAGLFEKAERHEAVARALAARRRGMTRTQLLAVTGLGSGGAITKVLDELEQCGFVMQMPRLGHAKRDAVYWLADHYSLFFLKWVEHHRGGASGAWQRKRASPAWRAWSGLAFEAVCLRHIDSIRRALGIAGVETVEGTWEQRSANDRDGVQVDLVIDRADRSVNLCEMKFSESEFVIDKAYARELERKRDAYR